MGLKVSGSTNISIDLVRRNPATLGTSGLKRIQGGDVGRVVDWISGDGSLAKQIDLLYQEVITIDPNTTINRDFNALIDPDVAEDGVLITQSFRKVRLMVVFTDPNNKGTIEWGPSVLNSYNFIFKDATDRVQMDAGYYGFHVNEDNKLGNVNANQREMLFFNSDLSNSNTVTMIVGGTTT